MKPEPLPTGKIQQVITVAADTIERNGNQISFDAVNQQNALLRCTYTLKTTDEIISWQQREDWLARLLVQGEIKQGDEQRNQHAFDYQRYLSLNGYSGILSISHIKQKQMIKGSSLQRMRTRLITHIEKQFPEKSGLYLLSLLAGYKDRRFDEISEVFAPSGVLHLFSISGMHMYFFLGLFQTLFKKLRWTQSERFFPFCLLIVFSSVLLGGSPSVWRASLLYLLKELTGLFRFKISAMDRFAIVLMALLCFDPLISGKTAGQLSLLMAWLLLCQPQPRSLIENIKQSQWLSILAAPCILYLFFEWPLFGGILTFVLVPFFCFFLLPVALILLLFSFFTTIPFLGIFEDILRGVESFLGLFSWTWQAGQPPLFIALSGLILGVCFYQKKKPILALFCCLVLPSMPQVISLEMSVTFVDVGQGDAILLKAPLKKEVILIDTGGRLEFPVDPSFEKKKRANAEFTLLPFLKGQGIQQIDKLFLTHGDTDHMGDLLTIAENVAIDTIYLAKGSQYHPNIQKVLPKLPADTKIREVQADTIFSDYFPLKILFPFKEGRGENEDSLVLAVQAKKSRFLFMGDLGKEGEKQLLSRYPNLTADVLKLGHHGSRTSTDSKFIETVQPRQAIVSCGANNRFGHPHQEVLSVLQEKNIEILRTDQQGMITYRWYPWQDLPEVIKMKEN